MTDRTLICDEGSCIGKFSVFIYNTPRLIIRIKKIIMSPLLAHRTEFGKCHILVLERRWKTVIWSTRTFKHKTADGCPICYDTLIADAYKCLTITITDIIVWSFLSWEYSKYYYLLSINRLWHKMNFWNRIHLRLDCLTDNLTIPFTIGKPDNLSFIVYTKQQLTTHAIGKGRNAL